MANTKKLISGKPQETFLMFLIKLLAHMQGAVYPYRLIVNSIAGILCSAALSSCVITLSLSALT